MAGVGETLGSKRVVTEELTEQQKRALEAIKASLHRMATKVLEAPRSEREAAYEIVSKGILKWRPPEFNVGDDEAVDFEAKYMSWLRALVPHIERSRGERGGTA